ncbi:hypothetical protein [Oceanirhabdus seepicola]|uniref:Uncharacterized protein n=1 Tax=Oceanirhabdus seepicola TaxID=2828781 RepID=A0A9J6NZ42_9CLOT|nr:hypothetical protein [Oceanirhabdus seepicola]MCM1989555.1 hypothetical protein [Oceanirhabdus seepicola]
MRKKYLIIILIAFVLCITGCSKSSSNIENYLNSGTTIDSNAKDIMPNLDDLPEYQNISYKYTHKSMFIFESDSVALIVNYDDKTYKSEKDKLAKKYTFLEEKVDSDYDESKYFIPEYEFSINSYTFKVVAYNKKSNTEFPKSFGMIGTSEEKKSIAYLYFCDFDLDCIGQENDKHPMADFVKNYFDYDF